MYKYILVSLCLIVSTSKLSAQLKTPASSPPAKIVQTIGLTEIEISYSRPSMSNRSIFGEDGLIPFLKQWRTGANGATKFKFSTDVFLQDKLLPKGEYTIISTPDKDHWQIHFYHYESSNWTKYRSLTPLISLNIPSKNNTKTVETFEINLEDIEMESCNINLKWENTIVTIPVAIAIHDKVLKSIDNVLSGPSAFDYYNAADYLSKTDTDLERSLSYIQKATSSTTQMFFFYRTESLIYAKLGRYKEAIQSAQRSIELSRKAKNEDFIRLSQQSIREWEAK